jgi:hypothetical protein
MTVSRGPHCRMSWSCRGKSLDNSLNGLGTRPDVLQNGGMDSTECVVFQSLLNRLFTVKSLPMELANNTVSEPLGT